VPPSDIVNSPIFGRPFVKRFALYAIGPLSCLSVLSVCDVGVLWPNGWTDQDETWHAARPRPWPHCVRWGPAVPFPKGHSPQFSAHICCGQMAAWIKMSLGMELRLGPGYFVLDGDPGPLPKRGRSPLQIFGLCLLRPNAWMDEAGTWQGFRPQPRRLCVRWGPSPLPKKGTEPPPQFSAHFYCGQTAACIKMPLGMEVGLSPGDFVLDGDPQRGTDPQFSAHICCGQMDAWIKMSLGMKLDLSPGDFVLDGDSVAPSPKGGWTPQIFGPCLL